MSALKNVLNDRIISPEAIEKLKQEFQNAEPCKHIVIDNFLTDDLANTLYDKFPKMEDLKVVRKSFNENKREDYHFEKWDPSFTTVRETLLTKDMNDWMSTVCGIDNLFTNKDPLGQGVHQGGPGSFLDVHIDVNVNVAAKLWRRINLLIYLNKNWQPEYGGDIEIWNKDMTACAVKYAPSFNRAVIFLTDENSPHGYSKLNIPEHESRKSYYAYYYTHLEEGVAYSDSRFLSRPDDSITRKTITSVKENLKITVKKVLSKLNITKLDFQDKNDQEKK